MAESVNSTTLSALTEGLNSTNSRKSSRQVCSSSATTLKSVESTAFSTTKSAATNSGIASTSANTPREDRKRKHLNVEPSTSYLSKTTPSKRKRSSHQFEIIEDCIAQRTRSKTVSPEDKKKQQPEVATTQKAKRNLLNYYRTTKNNHQNVIKPSGSSGNSSNKSSPIVNKKLQKTPNKKIQKTPLKKNNILNNKKSKSGKNKKIKSPSSKSNVVSKASTSKFYLKGLAENTKKEQSLRRSIRGKTGSCVSNSTAAANNSESGGVPNASSESPAAVASTSDRVENPFSKFSPGNLNVQDSNLMAQQSNNGTQNVNSNDQSLLGSNSTNTGATTTTTTTNSTGHGDSESDDSEVGRLQALLEARGLPPHLFNALGPRMSHILHRTMGNSTSNKAQQLLQGLQSADESQQLQAAIEMCQMLVMGNEDTLSGFPIKQVVPALIILLRMEHNFDIMNNACRALAYMLEALPRSSATVVDAVPVFLEKLQSIQCMDVAEQSLTALNILSRRHHKVILQANGISACLTYLDFFSINAQRAALTITANCCLNMNADEFHFIKDNLEMLARLLTNHDKKCLENICTAFYRLVESFQNDSAKLKLIASSELLKNCQQLLVITPTLLNTGTFSNIVRMLAVMCGSCPDLAVILLRNNIAATILYLLADSSSSLPGNDIVILNARSPGELYDITCLIAELMPNLPKNDIFSVDVLLERQEYGFNVQDQIQWQWKDDRGSWHSYSSMDSRLIETAHLNSDDEISLNTLGRTYTIDFHTMQQINEETGTTRNIQRKVNTNNMNMAISESDSNISDARIELLKDEYGLASDFIKSLFNVLYEVYSSSAGPAIRYKCLRALLRMIYYANPNLLKEVLKNQAVSSHIAGMLASTDIKIVVGALQMSEILMKKMPDLFGNHFKREGVIHQITLLSDPKNPICPNVSPKNNTSSDSRINSNLREEIITKEENVSSCSFTMNQTKESSPSTPSTSVMSTSSTANYFSLTTNKTSLNRPSTSASAIVQSESTPNSTLNEYSTSFSSFCGSTSSPAESQMKINNSAESGTYLIYTTPKDLSSMQPSSDGKMYSMRSETTQNVLFSTASSHQMQPSTSSTRFSGERTSSSSAAEIMQNKVSDILRKRVPPKRKSQSSNKSKSRSDQSGSAKDGDHKPYSNDSSGRNTPTTSGIGIRSRFSSATCSTTNLTRTSFLTHLNPTRWGRQSHNNSSKESSSNNNSTPSPSASSSSGPPQYQQTVRTPTNVLVCNKEKARQWIRQQSTSFINHYSDLEKSKYNNADTSILNQLYEIIEHLSGDFDKCLEALFKLKEILMESDISSFEINHSGLLKSMLKFLTNEEYLKNKVSRENRIKVFLHVFANLPLTEKPQHYFSNIQPQPFSAFIGKLHACITQLEQFPIKVHDFPSSSGGRSNISALKFFNTHQLKCNLQRHPDCNNLRQWKGGTVKIDPLALVQAIERYLVVRGYAGIRGDSDEDSDEDVDDNVASVAISQVSAKHKLQFLIGDQVLPYNMTVYQAVKQFSPLVSEHSELDGDMEAPLGNTSIWTQQHTIYYRLVEEETSASLSPNSSQQSSVQQSIKKPSKSSSKSNKKKMEYWYEGNVSKSGSPLSPFLVSSMPQDIVTVQDSSLDALCLLRIMNAFNRYWNSLYINCIKQTYIIPQSEFIHPKLSAKANRQLQDPLVIMTGNLPQWLHEIPIACPFLFPFETRHLLFYAVTFDRDRALQRLLDTTPDLNSVDTTERVTPRLDRRKRSISREDILKQAEQLIQDFGHSKALLEIQYDNEVGTGLGPTLEFYALISKEIQRTDLGLWVDSNGVYESNSVDVESSKVIIKVQPDNYNNIKNEKQDEIDENLIKKYVFSANGLFPLPLSRSAKISNISKAKSKFKFLGKLMAKAVMDSRMLDLPFSQTFYRWLLHEESTLNLGDLAFVAPEIQSTLVRLQNLVYERNLIISNPNLSPCEKTEKIEKLELDGCSVSDLGLDFVLPGFHNIELRKGGKDIPVTIHNVHQYIDLVNFWFINEGVQKQFEALREGFDLVFSSKKLKIFYPEELENVFCGSSSDSKFQEWDVKLLQECCRVDHGYTQTSQTIQYLYDILSKYDKNEQRSFLQFVTGSPRLPTGGFKALSPPLTIVRKTLDTNQNPNDYLPSVMTCVNYLKLPEYSSPEIMAQKLKVAANEGSMSFHLS